MTARTANAKVVTEPLLRRHYPGPYPGSREMSDEEGVPMSGQIQEAPNQHLLFLVESAQRAGLSEVEIGEMVDEAVAADADLDRAA